MKLTNKTLSLVVALGLTSSFASANTITSAYSLEVGAAYTTSSPSNFTGVEEHSSVGGNIALDMQGWNWFDNKLGFGTYVGISSINNGYLPYLGVSLSYNAYKGLVVGGTFSVAGYKDDTYASDYTGLLYGGKIGYDFGGHHGVNLTYQTGTLSESKSALLEINVNETTLNYVYHF